MENEIENNGERDSLGRKKRRWGFNREQRAALRKAADEAQSSVTDEHRLRLLWKENFDALDQQTQSDFRQREKQVLYLSCSMMLFLQEFKKDSIGLLPPVYEPCSTFCEIEEYLQEWPLLQIYLPDCLTFSLAFGIDLESQRVREVVPCDGYRNYGLRVSLGGGSWPDTVDVNGAGLYYRFVLAAHAYCQKHPGDVDSAVAQKAKEFVESRVKPHVGRDFNTTPATVSVPGFIQPLPSHIESELRLNQKIKSDVRESIKRSKEELEN